MLRISQDIPEEPCRENVFEIVPRKFPEILFWWTFLWKFPWISPKLVHIFSRSGSDKFPGMGKINSPELVAINSLEWDKSNSPEWAIRISTKWVTRNYS